MNPLVREGLKFFVKKIAPKFLPPKLKELSESLEGNNQSWLIFSQNGNPYLSVISNEDIEEILSKKISEATGKDKTFSGMEGVKMLLSIDENTLNEIEI